MFSQMLTFSMMSLTRMLLGAMTLKWNHVFLGVMVLLSEMASSRYYPHMTYTCSSVTCLISPILPLSKSDSISIFLPLSRLNSYLFLRDLLSSELVSCLLILTQNVKYAVCYKIISIRYNHYGHHQLLIHQYLLKGPSPKSYYYNIRQESEQNRISQQMDDQDHLTAHGAGSEGDQHKAQQEQEQGQVESQAGQEQSYQNELVKWKQKLPQGWDKFDLSSTTYSEWAQNRLDQICQAMDSWDINCLWIGQNREPSILKHLQDVALNQLIRIDVSGNCIESIELLCRMTLPSLKELYMQENYVFNLEPMRRCTLPMLYFIGIGTICHIGGNNLIQDASCLARMELSGLTWLGLQHTECSFHSYDIRWVVKMNTDKLNMLQMDNPARMKQDRLDKVLLRRFLSLEQVNRM